MTALESLTKSINDHMASMPPPVQPSDPYDKINQELDGLQKQMQPAVDEANSNASLIDKYVKGELPTNPQMGGTESGGNGTPSVDTMVQIKDNQTGQLMQVPSSQLSQYGLNSDGTPTTPSQPTFQGGNPAMGSNNPQGNASVTNNMQAAGAPNFINPQSGQEATDQQATQQAWRSAKNLQQQDNIAQTWAGSHGYDLFGTKPLSAQQTDLQNLNRKGNSMRTNVQHALNTYEKISSTVKGNPLLAGIAADLPISTTTRAYEDIKKGLGDMGKFLPDPGDSNATAQMKLQQLDAGMRQDYGYGLDSKYLQQFGMTRDQNGEAIPSGKQTSQPGLPERILTGAKNDVGAMASGLGTVAHDYMGKIQSGEMPSQAIGETAINMGKGVVNEYGQLVGATTKNGQPILPQNKSVFQAGGVNVPNGIDLNAAKNHALDHPLNTALDLLPLKGLAGAKGAEGAAVAGESGANAVADASKISDVKANTFASNYTMPSKLAREVNPIATSKEILAHVQSGMKGDLNTIPSQVTGDTGVITQMTRDAVAKIPGEIPMGEPIKAATNILQNKVGITAKDIKAVTSDINNSSIPGENIMQMKPVDAYNQVRQLENTGYDYLRGTNISDKLVGKAYIAASKSIMDQIEQAAKGTNVMEGIKTPEALAKIDAISPRLGAQVRNANSLSDLRSTASPFVRLGKMQGATDASVTGIGTKMSNAMTSARMGPFTRLGQTAGAAVGGMFGMHGGGIEGGGIGMATGGMVGRIGGNVLDRAAQPVYNAAIEKAIPSIRNIAINGLNMAGKPLKLGKQAVNVGKVTRFNNPQRQMFK